MGHYLYEQSSNIYLQNRNRTTMTDQNANLKGYSYQEMSSKVEQSDRSLLRSRAHEPTGEVESLRGRNKIGRMGDRVIGGEREREKHTRPSELLRDQQKK